MGPHKTSKAMSTEELMKLRYEVIADWPGNNCFLPGEIIFKDDHRTGNPPLWVNLVFSGFPHLFKPLQWWEKRDFSLAGMYIRAGAKDSTHTCYKLLQREDHPHMELWTMECGDREHCYPLNGDNIVPIEQSEYDQYIKSKEK
jgi:hypothetical protein